MKEISKEAEERRMLKPDDRKPAEWALLRGVYLYNAALMDELNGHMQARDWENAIALAIQDAYADGVRRGAQMLEERLGA